MMRATLLFLFAISSGFGWEKYNRYVFTMMDSNFVVKARTESIVHSSKDPDTGQILDAARSTSMWQDYHLNSKAVGETWLAYMPPADPGEIVFVSNTVPTYPLLRLRIDAMCGGCFSQFEVFGNLSVPLSTDVKKGNVKVVDLDNDFKLGDALNETERTKIADRINDFQFAGSADTIRIHVLKMRNVLESRDGIRYIASYVFTVESGSAMLPSANRRPATDAPKARFDILGRTFLSGFRGPMLFLGPSGIAP